MVDLKEIKEQYFPEPEPKKAMEVKEAIKINKIYKKLPLNIDEAKKIVDYISNSFMVIINTVCGNKSSCKNIDDIIFLLQQGEALKIENKELKAYRQIVEDMKNEQYDVWVSLPGYFTILPEFVKKLEQKYFGKEEQNVSK